MLETASALTYPNLRSNQAHQNGGRGNEQYEIKSLNSRQGYCDCSGLDQFAADLNAERLRSF